MVYAASTSFPSGHALGVMACVLALSVALAPYTRRGLRPWLAAAGVIVIVAVGVGRVALNVHHPSDVVAGWALGYLWFLACLPLLGRGVRAAAETPEVPGTTR
jgi:undecaprenyl-diphosphatase